MQHREALSLHDEAASRSLLLLLKEADFSPQTMVVRVQSSSIQNEGSCAAYEPLMVTNAIKNLMLECLKADVRIESVKPRRGFPKSYMLLGRKALLSDRTAPSAGFCMAELQGAFFALAVFHELQFGKENAA
jgi:hypothetical protein